MKNQNFSLSLFWIGLLIAVAFAGIIGRSLYQNLRTLTIEELDTTIWAMNGPVFMLWAFSVPLGSLLAGIGAFIYVKTKPVFLIIKLKAEFFLTIFWPVI